MVKKKEEVNKDLTRLEDLSEFLHQEDSDLDSRFDDLSPDELTFERIDLDSLDEPPAIPEISPELPADDTEEENPFEVSSLDEISFESSETEFGSELEENTFGDASTEENLFEGSVEEDDNELLSDNPMESSGDSFPFGSPADELSESVDLPDAPIPFQVCADHL